MKIVYNIKWNIDFDEVYEELDKLSAVKAAAVLGLPEHTYSNMTTEERHDYAYSKFHHSIAELEEFLGLPNRITVPEYLANSEEISDWLSDKYGYCHEGFDLLEKN